MPKSKPYPESGEDLKTLGVQARHDAEQMMLTNGSVPPTLMALTPEGFVMMNMRTDPNKPCRRRFKSARLRNRAARWLRDIEQEFGL